MMRKGESHRMENPSAHAPETNAAEETPTPKPPSSPHVVEVSYWPAVMGLGMTLLLFGVVTDVLFSLLGGLLIIIALGGWIGELLHG